MLLIFKYKYLNSEIIKTFKATGILENSIWVSPKMSKNSQFGGALIFFALLSARWFWYHPRMVITSYIALNYLKTCTLIYLIPTSL